MRTLANFVEFALNLEAAQKKTLATAHFKYEIPKLKPPADIGVSK
jgi:hypothetical protein